MESLNENDVPPENQGVPKMSKFLSHDGVDNNNVRAEVMVQTGTGKIKEFVGRGRADEHGVFRNMEVVFEPDNPHLKRKVYAMLDTTSADLWKLVQEAQADQRDISYRIESQRKRNVERTTKFEELTHTEEVVRILAAIDGIFSHEAKTNPKEDPSGENPSALDQDRSAIVSSTPAQTSETVLAVLASARKAGLPNVTVDTLVALALSSGATMEAALSVGLDSVGTAPAPSSIIGRSFATEEKPWNAYNSDGRVNAGSYMVTHAAHAEQFALDHLIKLYSEGKKTPVDVSELMISQAASLALEILLAADEVQTQVTGRPDRQKNSYNRGLDLVLDAVDKRYPAPVGEKEEIQNEWKQKVVAEASERLYGIIEISQGRLPLSEAERATQVTTNEPTPTVQMVVEPTRSEETKPEVAATPKVQVIETQKAVKENTSGKSGADIAMELLQAKNIAPVNPIDSTSSTGDIEGKFIAPVAPSFGEAGFIPATVPTVERVRKICVAAAAGKPLLPAAISDWLELTLGVRSTRKVHEPVLAAFATHYETIDPAIVRAEIEEIDDTE